MQKPATVFALFVALATIAGCSNKLSGDLTVDGNAFELDACRSGQVYGFRGVELSSKKAGKVRLAVAPTGEAVAFYMPPDADKGVELGRCGTLKVNDQKSTINDIRNVEGSADLSCEAAGHSIKGKVQFSNCH